jgi:two-component system sensor histidine kinase UhpB
MEAAAPFRLRAAAERIAAGEPGVRVPVPKGDETVAALARALNAVQQQREDDRRRLRDVAARAFRAQESERARLAHELQEETAQTLSSLLFRLRAARRQADPALRDAALDSVRTLLSETADGVRGFARRLLPPALNDAGLAAALRGYAASLAESSGVSIVVACGEVSGLLSRDGELALYRVVQEALGNAVRHAAPSRIGVEVAACGGSVCARVADDGAGFDLGARHTAHPCLGLFGMRERALYAGGSAHVESVPGRGTLVVVEIPVAGHHEDDRWPTIVPLPVEARG